jgi:RNA polymerase sigma factor (sigma-70 family)
MGCSRLGPDSALPAGIPASGVMARTSVGRLAREQALILAVRAGDKEALGELYAMHRAGALSFSRSLMRDGHDAEDVFHEAFTKTINAIINGSGPTENFGAYLFTAVRATSAYWWQRHYREFPAGAAVLGQDAALDPRLEAVTDRAGHEHILAALQSLPERWQKVLWYTDVLGLKPREIAPLMGIAPNAVSSLALRARKSLRAAYVELLHANTQARNTVAGPDA